MTYTRSFYVREVTKILRHICINTDKLKVVDDISEYKEEP